LRSWVVSTNQKPGSSTGTSRLKSDRMNRIHRMTTHHDVSGDGILSILPSCPKQTYVRSHWQS
jgi:hypothetical protein